MALTKIARRNRIRWRIRKKIRGTNEKPRMSVFRSNKNIYVQLINDVDQKTIVAASSLEKDIHGKTDANKKDQAKMVGESFAKKAIEKGVNEVVFDRSGYLYHGRVKTLADSAREAGLKF